MHFVVRSFVAAALVLGACLGAAEAVAGKKGKCQYHYTNALDPLREEIGNRYDAEPDRHQKQRLGHIVATLDRCTGSIEDECSAAANAGTDMANFQVTGLEEVLRAIADELDDRVSGEIDRIGQYLDIIAIAGNDTSEGQAIVDKARTRVADARLLPAQYQRLRGISQAIHEVAGAKKQVSVKKPPAKCKGRRLAKGEYCDGVATSGLLVANIGEGTVRRDSGGSVTAIDLFFQYCNGVGADRITIDFTVAPFAGESDIAGQGGYQEGLGFELAMRPGSKATVTAVSAEQGVIEGTFSFTVNGESVGGGRFRLNELTDPK